MENLKDESSTDERRPQRRYHRSPIERSGERVRVDEQGLLLIDQFMIGNPQFIEPIRKAVAEDNLSLAHSIVSDFGGAFVPLPPGEYRVLRNPIESTMVALPVDSEELSNSDMDPATLENDLSHKIVEASRGQASLSGRVLVDTRCLVLCPFSLLLGEAPDRFRELRLRRAEKSGRDLLRSNGAAVRYGFAARGDELGVYRIGERLLALWPDVIDA